jgi:2-dehydro-3-deoxygalactonokinase
MTPHFIAVDWGTSRLRAYLVGADNSVIAETASDEGMAKLAKNDFAAVLARHVDPWRKAHPGLKVLMAGMVGSRNGWCEAPYVACPAPVLAIAAGGSRVRMADGDEALIVPGLCCVNDGVADVMRGEETLILGAGIESGTVVLPGTHSKWATLRNGRIESFRTYMTGEFFALLTGHSVLRLLAEEPEDQAGFAKGLAASARPGGLTHQAFAARAEVLLGALSGRQVKPYLSGLLIGNELRAVSDNTKTALVVADRGVAANYCAAMEALGIAVRLMPPRDCLVAGLARVLAAVK